MGSARNAEIPRTVWTARKDSSLAFCVVRRDGLCIPVEVMKVRPGSDKSVSVTVEKKHRQLVADLPARPAKCERSREFVNPRAGVESTRFAC